MNLHQTLQAVMKSDAYNDPRMTDGPDGSRAAALTSVINKFKEAAIKKLLSDKTEPLHADFLARVTANEIKKRKAYDSSFTGIGQ